MKQIYFLLLFLLLSVLISCNKNKDEIKNDNTKYIAYYFHPTARCEGCMNMEAYLKEIIDKKYAKEGITFIGLNIEDTENEHFRKDFDLKYSSVILVKVEGDKNTKWKNLDSVWSYTENKQKFFEYSEKEINNFIKQ
jgi:hypothetical protein